MQSNVHFEKSILQCHQLNSNSSKQFHELCFKMYPLAFVCPSIYLSNPPIHSRYELVKSLCLNFCIPNV